MLLKIFGLSLWMGLFIMLWSCLCYIPGIIAALRYSQAFYILAEDPNKGIRQCVNESKELMSGHLWEFFVRSFPSSSGICLQVLPAVLQACM